MEGNLIIFLNESLILLKIEDNLNFLKMEGDLHCFNIFFFKQKTTSIFFIMEDDLIFFIKWKLPQYSGQWKTNSKVKNKQCNLKQIKNDCYAFLKNSTAFSVS